jgi:REP element-mobilizing transposase RayT
MPRRSRLDLPGSLHHICIRGVDGRRIFVDEADPVDLLRRYERWSLETKTRSLAWSLDGNHAHFVIERGEQPMAVLMARFTGAFAQRFNWRHERRGHLFMRRYESRRIRDESDLRWMVLYASANAVRHGAMGPPALDLSAESSWAGMMGTREPHSFEALDIALALYGEDVEQSRHNLRAALAMAIETKWAPPQHVEFAALVREVCTRLEVDIASLHRGKPNARAARQEIILRAVAELQMRRIDIAAKLGISTRQISRVRRVP